MPQKILILAANPKGTPSRRLEEEVREIDAGLQRASHREQFILEQKWAVRPRDIGRAMLDLKPQIVHFSGHGTGDEGLVFEDETGSAKLVDGEALAGLFKLFAEGVECVVLNGCYSEVQAEAISQHIDYVIGMKKAIGDQAAIEFAVGFYDALGAGETLEFAYNYGCAAIQVAGIAEQLTPSLKKRSNIEDTVPKISSSNEQLPVKNEPASSSDRELNSQNSRAGSVRPTLFRSEGEPPPLLPYLADRSEQEFELYKALKKFREQIPPRPLVCVIHGNDLQSHDKFLERLQKLSFPRLLDLDLNQTGVNQYQLPWPSNLKNLNELSEQLRKSLADNVLYRSSALLEDINEFFRKYPAPIIIHTHLLTKDWQQQGPGVLNELLKFWHNWPELTSDHELIICLFIKYKVDRRSSMSIWLPSYWIRLFKQYRNRRTNKKIQEQIEALAASELKISAHSSLIVLPELINISRKHVEDWTRDEATKHFVGEEMIERLRNAVREIFDSWEEKTSSEKIPMEDLANELTHLLKSLTITRRDST